MLNARIGERFLSLVMTRERASSIVGDLEETRSSGILFPVVHTFVAMLFKDTVTNIGRLTGTAGLGFVSAVFAMFASVVALAMTIGAVIAFAWVFGLRVTLPPWLLPMSALLVLTAVAYGIGTWMARRCPGHEVAVCVTFVLMHSALELILLLVTGDRVYVANVASGWIFDTAMFVGAIRARARALRAPTL